jgi:hypothetical protein
MRGDLTTLERVREWLAPGQGTLATTNDSMISRLISSASAFVINELNRNIAVTEYDEWYDSGGLNFVNLRQWPIQTVAAVQFESIVITDEATGVPPLNGWRLMPPSRLMVTNYRFPRGRSTVRVQYTAGYQTNDEAHTVPATPWQVPTYLTWLSDLGVTLEDGTPLVAVSGTPGPGEYSVTAGVYLFDAAQEDAVVLISYSSVPADIDQCVVEMVGERFKMRDRIGVRSKTLPNGESVVFELKALTDPQKQVIDNYRRVI